MNPYTIGSLFAGIGGFDLGFERAGFKTAWQVEIDPYCQKVLAKNFPEAERFGDIRECGSHNLKPVDVICGGFPCQDISNAGEGVGIIGERSGLWKEFARLVEELRPKFAVIENVPALLGKGLALVLQNLWSLGFDAEWHCVPASAVGAHHERDRVWIVAYHAGMFGEALLRRESFGLLSQDDADADGFGCDGWTRQQRTGRWSEPSNCDTPSDADGEPLVRAAIGRGERHAWTVEPGVVRMVYGVPSRVDRLRSLGNTVVPQIPEMIARRIKQALEDSVA